MHGIDTAIERAGSQAKLAQRLREITGRRLTQQAVSAWRAQQYVPGAWVLTIAREYGIPPSQLNPELYPVEAA